MKLITFVAVIVSSASASAVNHHNAGKLATTAQVWAKVTPHDISMCLAVANEFMDKPMRKDRAIERANDWCALHKAIDDWNFVCPHYKEGLSAAFKTQSSDKDFTPEEFCYVAEQYMLDIRGAARIAGLGAGPLTNFAVADTCASLVLATLAPEKELQSSHVPDFWYAMCVNQDCAHFLQSRTRWCKMSQAPTHSIAVCEAARDFAKDEITVVDDVVGGGKMNAKEICDVYGEYVKEMGNNVEAYEHVMHTDSSKHVPVPSDAFRALQSTQLKNGAAAHKLRDSAGEVLEKAAAAPVAFGPLVMIVVALRFM